MPENAAMENTARFNFGFYFHALTGLLASPGQFFGALPKDLPSGKPFVFLVISSLFFTGASLTYISDKPVLMAGILLINAVGMPLIGAGIGYMAMTMSIGKHVTFSRLFSVYGFAAGVTLLVSWIPLFVWLTEPWKWLLTTTGMVKACGLKWMMAFLIIGLSIIVQVLLFWSLGPVVLYVKGIIV